MYIGKIADSDSCKWIGKQVWFMVTLHVGISSGFAFCIFLILYFVVNRTVK